MAFSMKADFRHEFCSKNVREGVVIQFISYVLETCKVSKNTSIVVIVNKVSSVLCSVACVF